MKKIFKKLPGKSKRAAFANMENDCHLYKQGKSGKRSKGNGFEGKCKRSGSSKKRKTTTKSRRRHSAKSSFKIKNFPAVLAAGLAAVVGGIYYMRNHNRI